VIINDLFPRQETFHRTFIVLYRAAEVRCPTSHGNAPSVRNNPVLYWPAPTALLLPTDSLFIRNTTKSDRGQTKVKIAR